MDYYREVESSQVHAIGYDSSNRVLYVFFNSGVGYKYFNIDTNLYASLSRIADQAEGDIPVDDPESAPPYGKEDVSFGKFLNKNVKNVGYDYQRIKQDNKDLQD